MSPFSLAKEPEDLLASQDGTSECCEKAQHSRGGWSSRFKSQSFRNAMANDKAKKAAAQSSRRYHPRSRLVTGHCSLHPQPQRR
jgi:hypothetical protein